MSTTELIKEIHDNRRLRRHWRKLDSGQKKIVLDGVLLFDEKMMEKRRGKIIKRSIFIGEF